MDKIFRSTTYKMLTYLLCLLEIMTYMWGGVYMKAREQADA
jgi:hypothetical protein